MGTSALGLTGAHTGNECIMCGEDIVSSQEILLTTISYVLHTDPEQGPYIGGGLEAFDVLDDEGKELAFTPLFFCVNCWDDVTHDLDEIVANEPPVKNEADTIRCSFCTSGILEGEHFCMIQEGALNISPQRPEGEVAYEFEPSEPVHLHMCLSCMTHVHEQVLEIWEDVSQNGECADCAHARCWRGDSCVLECACHEEDEEP